jgi:hypothetical protein
MPAATNVKVTFTGDTSQLTAATATANKALASTGAAADTADKKMKALNDEAGRVGDSMGKAGGSAAKAAGALSMLSPGAAGAAGSLADLADVGELAAEAAAALGVSATAAAFALGAVLSAVALLTAAYAGWNEEAATATRLTEEQNALTAATAPLYADTEAAIRGAKVELGLMTEAQSAMIDAGIAGLAQYQAATETTRKRLSELRAQQASITGQVSALVGDIGEALPLQEYNMAAQIIDGLTTSTDEFNMEEGALQDGLTRTSDALRENRVAHEKLGKAKQQGKAATSGAIEVEKAAELAARARAEAEADLTELLKARAAAEQEYADGVASLRDIEREANSDRLTEIEALDQARADQMAALNASLTEQLAAVEGNELKQAEIEQAGRDARLALEQRYQRDKGAIVEEGNAAIADENAQAQADAADAAEASRGRVMETLKFAQGYAEQVAGVVSGALTDAAAAAGAAFDEAQAATMDAFAQVKELGDLLDGLSTETVDAAKLSGTALTDAYREGKVSAEDLTESQKKQIAAQLENEKQAAAALAQEQQAAAMQAWQAQHDAAVATAALNIPVAISQALSAAPFPFNLPLAAAAGALAAKAAADVASAPPPSFRSGYLPDQQLAMIEPQSELVAPASAVQALGGMDAARAAFAGQSGAGAPVVTQFTIGHKGYSALTANSMNRPGPLRDLSVRPAGRVNPYSRRSG